MIYCRGRKLEPDRKSRKLVVTMLRGIRNAFSTFFPPATGIQVDLLQRYTRTLLGLLRVLRQKPGLASTGGSPVLEPIQHSPPRSGDLTPTGSYAGRRVVYTLN
ncbi:unnamed protein product, partial [Nesidiocoris tenuis]